MNELLKITIIPGHTKIENNTDFDLWISLRPDKPNKKIEDRYKIGPYEFLILLFEIDPMEYCLYWKKSK